MKKTVLSILFLIITISPAFAANRYWVGGGSSANWNATGPTNWGSASNTQDNASVPGASDAVIFDGVGTGASNSTISANITILSLNMTGYTNTLTHNTSVTLTVAGSVTLASGMTYTPASVSSVISMSATGTLTTNGIKPWAFLQTGGGTVTLGSNYTGANQRTAIYTGSSTGTTSLDGFTMAGSSNLNRLLIRSATVGDDTAFTIAGGTFANADFMDITANTLTDVSAISGLSGDCGGNTNLTLTTPAAQVMTSDNSHAYLWSNSALWTSRVPLAQDDVTFSGNFTGTITNDMRIMGKSIDFSGVTGLPDFDQTMVAYIFGSFNLTNTGGLTVHASGTSLTFGGRSSYIINEFRHDIYGTHTIAAPGGTYTLNNDLFSVSGGFVLTAGSFDMNNYNLQAVFTGSGSLTRSFTCGTGKIKSSSSGTLFQNATTTNLTWSCASGSIELAYTGATATTFQGGGLTYGNVFNNMAGGTTLTIAGSNTFKNFKVVAGGKTNFTAGTTQQIESLTATGTSGSGITLGSSTTSVATLNCTNVGGKFYGMNYVTMSYLTLTNCGTVRVGANSTDNGNNTGWTFASTQPVGVYISTLQTAF